MKLVLSFLLLILTIITVGAQDSPLPTYSTTYHAPTGNRMVDGVGSFPDVTAFAVQTGGAPLAWLVGLPTDEGVRWLVQDEQNTVTALDIVGDTLTTETLPEPYPAVMWARADDAALPGMPLPPDAATLSHPVVVDERLLYISAAGEIVLTRLGDETSEVRLDVNALPDARIVIDSAGERAAVYIAATDARYVHDVLGDPLEAASLVVVALEDLAVLTRIDLPGTAVFEGLSPLWADVNEDGDDDLIVTVSDFGSGAGIRAYTADDGTLIAQGPVIGLSGRWRHQLAWGAFGSNGENELVDVLTPHLGGVVEFYRLDGDRLTVIAERSGYTSHIIGTRNLDMAVAGDFDGDGQPEIVMPTQDRTRVVGLVHQVDGVVSEAWSLPLDGGRVVTNLSATTDADGRLGLAVGTDDGRVWVWMSR